MAAKSSTQEQIAVRRVLRPGALEVPRGIFVSESITWQPRWLWIALWNLAGRRAGTVTTSKIELAGLLKRNELRSIDHYIEHLEAAGVIESRNEPHGLLCLYVHDPDLADPLYASRGRSSGRLLFDKFFSPDDAPMLVELPAPILAASTTRIEDGAAFSPGKTPRVATTITGENAVPLTPPPALESTVDETPKRVAPKYGHPATANLPVKTPARNSLFGGGGGLKFKIPPPPSPSGLTPKLLEAKLQSIGLALAKMAVSSAIDAGLSLSEIAWAIAFWDANRPAWEVGVLYHRFVEVRNPRLRVDEGWPRPSTAWTKAHTRQTDATIGRRAEHERDRKRAESEREIAADLERRLGPMLDGLSPDRLNELAAERLAGQPILERQFRRHGVRSALVRERLLAALADREVTADAT